MMLLLLHVYTPNINTNIHSIEATTTIFKFVPRPPLAKAILNRGRRRTTELIFLLRIVSVGQFDLQGDILEDMPLYRVTVVCQYTILWSHDTAVK